MNFPIYFCEVWSKIINFYEHFPRQLKHKTSARIYFSFLQIFQQSVKKIQRLIEYLYSQTHKSSFPFFRPVTFLCFALELNSNINAYSVRLLQWPHVHSLYCTLL